MATPSPNPSCPKPSTKGKLRFGVLGSDPGHDLAPSLGGKEIDHKRQATLVYGLGYPYQVAFVHPARSWGADVNTHRRDLT